MSKKTSIYVLTLILGIVLVVVGLILKGVVEKSISGVMFGIGASLFGMSLSNLFMKHFEQKHPDQMKQKEIELSDQRNEMIRYRAKAKSGDIIQWLIIGLAYIMILFNSSLWLIGLSVVIFLAYNLISIYYMGRYQKEM